MFVAAPSDSILKKAQAKFVANDTYLAGLKSHSQALAAKVGTVKKHAEELEAAKCCLSKSCRTGGM